jgi:hypothetical protein
MPELWTPKTVSIEFAREMYVGKDQLIASQNLYRELDEWATQWDRYAVETSSSILGAEDHAVEQETKRTMAASAGAGAGSDIDADSIPF